MHENATAAQLATRGGLITIRCYLRGRSPVAERRHHGFPLILRSPSCWCKVAAVPRTLALSAIVGCPLTLSAGRQTTYDSVELPLFDDAHRPDVLIESRRLEMPPSMEGNRFVSGWNSERREKVLLLHPRVGGSRIEVVNLESRSRRLVFHGEIESNFEDAEIRFQIVGRDPVSLPMTKPIEIPLANLPVSRVAIDLWFPGSPGDLAFDQAALRTALPAGEARIDSGEVGQTGLSRIDIVRRVPSGARLLGSFDPPDHGSKGQRFELTVSGEERSETIFEWQEGESRKWKLFDARLPSSENGLLRFSLLALGDGGKGHWRDLRLRVPQEPAESQPQPFEPSSPPKLVLLYVLDALRADRIGHLRHPADDSAGDSDEESRGVSPNIDALAAEGVTFTNHLSVAPNTMPSTKALFTGYAYRSRGGAPLPADGAQTIAEVFSAAGYRTAALAANLYISEVQGLVRGFDYEGGEHVHWSEQSREYSDSAEKVPEAALEWLNSVGNDERVFLYLHTLNPHNPYDPPEPFRSRFVDSEESSTEASSRVLVALRQNRRQATPADQKLIRDLYTASVAYNDAHLGSLLEIINSRYSAGEALVIVTSDHGDELFDHGGVLHGYTLYEEQLHIPLVFWWPGRVAPARSAQPTDGRWAMSSEPRHLWDTSHT